jgi:hypothetical protein
VSFYFFCMFLKFLENFKIPVDITFLDVYNISILVFVSVNRNRKEEQNYGKS